MLLVLAQHSVRHKLTPVDIFLAGQAPNILQKKEHGDEGGLHLPQGDEGLP